MFDVLICYLYFFFFKQKTAYEMRISDWSSDVCSSDLLVRELTTKVALTCGQDRDADHAGPAKLRPGGRLALDGKCDERRVKRDPNAERRGDDHMVRTISLRRERRNARRIKREQIGRAHV